MWSLSLHSLRASRETTCSPLVAKGLVPRPLPDGATILIAGDRRSRMRGLAGIPHLPADQALLIERCRSIHTVGMRFALDLLWLDGAGVVIRLDAHVRPRRLRTCTCARAVLETGAGCGERFARELAQSPRAV